MRACEKFGPSAENLGSNPHFEAILAFFGRWKGYFLRAQLTLGPSFLSLCCAVVISLAAYTHVSVGWVSVNAQRPHRGRHPRRPRPPVHTASVVLLIRIINTGHVAVSRRVA